MLILFNQSGESEKFFFQEARSIYKQKESKEKKREQTERAGEISPEETFDSRKAQASAEIESIYRNDKYAPYNLNNLPSSFRDHLRNGFAEWVKANIRDYDRDKNSGIDAAEYETFRVQLNEKVSGILDRLTGAKEERRKEAIAEKESAEAAKERQERLKFQDVSRIDPGNLIAPEELFVADPIRGLVTELIKYQEDWQTEVKQFRMFAAGDFTQVVGKIQKASDVGERRGLDAIAASSRNLQPWLEDTPEVKSAKDAREKAIADMQKRIEQMKKRQKERQERGEKLNAAPEAWRKKRQEIYEKAREEMRKKKEEAQEARRKNADAKRHAEQARKALEEKREEAQKSYDELLSRAREFEIHAQKAKEQAGAIAGSGSQKSAEGIAPEAAEELAKRAEAAIDPQLAEMRRQTATRHKHLLQLLEERGKVDNEIAQRNHAESGYNSTLEKIDSAFDGISVAESKEMEALDSVDKGIADTVLNIGTDNQQIIEQAQDYLKQLIDIQVRGPGIIDSIGAGILGVPGVEKVWNGVKSTASREWEFIKNDAVMGPVVTYIGYMGEGWVKAWDGIGAGFTWTGETLRLPQAWEWMGRASEHLSIGDPLSSRLGWLERSNLPSGFKTFMIHFSAAGDAIADTVTGGGLGTIVEVFAGVTEGAKDIVQGLGTVVQHPFQTMGGIKELANHPGMLVDAFIQRDKWGHESTSKIIGRGVTDAWTILVGGSAVSKGLARAKYARNIEKLSRSQAAWAGFKEGAVVWAQEWQKLLATIFRDIPVGLFKGPGSLLKTVAHGGKPAAKAAETAAGAAEAAASVVFPLVRRKPVKVSHAKSASGESKAPPPPSSRKSLGEADTVLAPHPDKSAFFSEQSAPTVLPPRMRKAAAHAEKSAPPPPSSRMRKPAAHAEKSAPPPPSSRIKKAAYHAEQVAPTFPAPGLAAAPGTARKLAESVSKSEIIKPIKRTPERTKMITEVERNVMARISEDSNFGPAIRKLGGPDEFIRRLDALPDSELRILLSSLSDLDTVLFERVLLRQFNEFTSIDGKQVRFYVGRHIDSGGFGSIDEVVFHFAGDSRLQRGAVKRVKSIEQLMEQFISEKEYNFYLQSRDRIFHNEKMAASAVTTFEDSTGLLRPRAISAIGDTHILIYDHIVSSFPGTGNDARLTFRVKKGESASNTLRFMDEALEGMQKVHENGYVYLDFKADQVFVGRPFGTAKTGPDVAVLGDLSLVHWTDLADLELHHAGGNSYAVLKRKKGQSIHESAQIGITPDYFSATHLQRLIAKAKKIAADLEAKGIDPSKVEKCPISSKYLAVADKHQIGVTLDNMVGLLLRRNKIPASVARKFNQKMDKLVARLRDPDDPITIAQVRDELAELRGIFDYAEANIDLPAIQA